MIGNILDILFNIFIFPIEFVMKNILDAMFDITNNYGLSIILLSIIINLIILPLYYLAEKLKNDNQKILDKLQPRIDFFKKHFKKQELHFYLQTFYKINNYHPINNIKASLGLLLQIPFFIAAFHFIGNYEIFNQVSFGAIRDLGKADGLLFGLNILPFMMTVINLLSVYLYSKNMNKSEKYQLLGMAFIFLVFLYFESSALLLYWSMNNLFSLIKNAIESYFNIDKFKNILTSSLIFPAKKIQNFFSKNIYVLFLLFFSLPLMTFYANNLSLLHFDISTPFFIFLEAFVVFMAWTILRVFLYEKTVFIILYQFFFIYLFAINRHFMIDFFDLEFSYEKTLLILLMLIISIATPILLKIKQKSFVLLLVFLNLVSIYSIFDKHNKNKNISNSHQINTNFSKFSLENNVYFLLADGYSGFNALKNADLFDNTSFYNDLKNKGFKTYPNAFSNYPRTYSSMRATFEMKHHKLKDINTRTTRFALQDFIFSGCNKVFMNFEQNDYVIYNNSKKAMSSIDCKKVNYENHSYMNNEPRDDLLFYLDYLNFKAFKKIYKKISTNLNVRLYEKIQYKDYFENFTKSIPINAKKQFIYIHSFGTIDSTVCNKAHLNDQLKSKGYIRQIKCANTDIMKSIKEIYKKDLNPLIILMADHASVWRTSFISKQNTKTATNTFNIIQAIRWPKQCQSFNNIEYISPINTFRYVFACLSQNNKYIETNKLSASDSYTINKWELGMKYNRKNKISPYKIIENNNILNTPIKVTQ